MIEVLRGPRNPKIICSTCGAILRYDKEDIRESYDFKKFIVCPCCSNPTYLKLKEEQNDKK